MNHPRHLPIIAVLASLIASSAISADAAAKSRWQPVTNPNQVPDNVYAALDDCPFITKNTAEWLNGDNLAIINIQKGVRMFFSVCDNSATQNFTAIVIERNGKADRQLFERFENGKLHKDIRTLASAQWFGRKRQLTAHFSTGCAAQSGTNMRYKWTGKRFKLMLQRQSDRCIALKKWPVIYRAK